MIVNQSPRDSALRRAQAGGEGHLWSVTDYLLALIADLLQSGNWQRAGDKHAPRPKPIPRPGEKPDGEHMGSDPIPLGEFDAWWDNPEGA